MKIQLFILGCCILQTIYGYNNTDELIYPPDLASERIVGGKDAPDGGVPYQCSLQSYNSHNCGCSILSNKYLLTASHCVVGHSPNSLTVLVGTNDLQNGGTYYKVEKYFSHEKYNRPRFANDVAVIQVKGTIEFNDRVQPIEPSPDQVNDGDELTLTGWGRLRAGGALPKRLQIIKLKALSTKTCKRTSLGGNVHDSHICTFTRVGEGACNGDSGGPLVFKNKVVGVVNFGMPCARGAPDGYASVAYLYDWIKQHTA